MYKPKKDSKYKKLQDDVLINAQNFYDGREMIINAFKDKMFPLNNPNNYPMYYQRDESPKSDSEDDIEEDDKLYREISSIDNKVDHKLIEKYLKKKSLLELFKYLRPSYKRALNDAKETVVEVKLLDLINDIKNMPDDEVKNKNLDLIKKNSSYKQRTKATRARIKNIDAKTNDR